MKQISLQTYSSPVGTLVLGACDDRLCMCDWPQSRLHESNRHHISKALDATFVEESSAILEQTARKLDEYFAGQRTSFDIPLSIVGTEFQNKIWLELLRVPYGETASYGTMAHRSGNPTAARAVAAAIGSNPLSIIIPCHRVIGSDGRLVGYAGGLAIKQKLLELEARYRALEPRLF